MKPDFKSRAAGESEEEQMRVPLYPPQPGCFICEEETGWLKSVQAFCPCRFRRFVFASTMKERSARP